MVVTNNVWPALKIFILIISYINQTKAACMTEEGDPCVFPFKDGSKSYSVCVKHKDRYWCSIKNKADGKYEKWGYCPEGGTCPLEGEHAGPVSNCKTTSGKSCTFPFKTACVDTKGNKCVFPFTYKDVKYTECTDKDGGGKKWCSLSTDENGMHQKGKYGYCIMEVCKDPAHQAEHKECVPATNEGQEGKGWCATTVGDDEVFVGWGYCKDPKCKDEAAAAAAPAGASNSTAGASNSTAAASNSTSNADIKGCLPCALSGILPSALGCLGADIFGCVLTKFDASCLIKGCLCDLIGGFGLEIVVNILAMIGLCSRG